MSPIVDGLAQEFTGQADVVQLNAAEAGNAQLMQRYGLRGHPTFVVLDENGRPVQTFTGLQTKEILQEALAAAVASAN